ncbi:hypothetical protein ACWC9U_37880 [Streptomyces sp. 900116325]
MIDTGDIDVFLGLDVGAAHGAVPFVERFDHDRVIAKDARPHALTDLLFHTRFIAHDRQSATRPP